MNKKKKKQTWECCHIDFGAIIKNINNGCTKNYHNPISSFKDGKYYIDGRYIGDIIYINDYIIKVQCKNGNEYMDGQIITMQRTDIKHQLN